MSGWVSAWLQGKNEGDEETKGGEEQQQADAMPAVIPSAEELRRKRLERLQQLQEQQAQERAAQQAAAEAVAPAAPVAATPPKPAAPPAVVIKAVVAPPAAAAVKKQKQSPHSNRSLMNDVLQRVLQLTLTPLPSRPDYLYMADFASQSGQTELKPSNVSEVLYSRVIMHPMQLSGGTAQPLAAVQYLEQTFYRCRDELQLLQSSSLRWSMEEKQQAVECIASIREMCINYSATALTDPEIFPFETGTMNADALEKLVRSQANALTPQYIEGVANELEQSDSTFPIFGPIFQKLLSELFLINPPSLLASFYPNMYTITVLCRVKPLATVFTSIPGFLLMPGMPFTGRRLQDATALGILLRFSSAQDPAVQQMFANITKRTKTDVENSLHSLRNKLTSVQNATTEIVKLLLKAGGPAREQVLTWLEQAMEVNAERAKENPDMNVASTNGTIINLSMVLLRLCGPFLPPESKKTHLINAQFLAVKSGVFPSDSTKLIGANSDAQNTVDDRRVADVASEFNFITRCYFITARAMHLGPVSVIGQYMRLLRQLSYFQSRMNDNADPRLRAHFEAMATSKMIMDAELLHPDLLHEMLRFVLLSCTVVNGICAGEQLQEGQLLPLPLADPNVAANAVLKHFPEHLVDDICAVLIFVARLQPKALGVFPLDDLLTMILIFLSTPAYVRSPHLRAKMSEVLFHVFLPSEEVDDRQTSGTASGNHLLMTNALAQTHLAPCLLGLYGDVEQTGFYEKLEHRYNIACLLKYLWKLDGHKAAFVRIAEDKENFVKFAHGLMNHINGLVTDALTSLPEIKILQEEMQDVTRWMALEESVREQKQSLLADKERTVTSSLQLANETIHMMSYLTSEIQAPFVQMPELEERLVSMLNSVLVKLAGPRGLELKVNNPEQYKFRPKEMLKEIVETLLHFAHYPSFQQAVAANGFYDAQVFAKCSQIVARTQLLSPESIEKLDVFVVQVAQAAQEVANLEETLGEIPDEFLDPLVFTLMKDPVILPSSGYTMDRSSIAQHLLNDQSDPFTRVSLTVDQLQPNHELKAKIEAWVKQQRQQS